MNNVALRWPAKKWEKAPLLCRLFGHIWKKGWYGDRPYFRSESGPVDGIGRHHISLRCQCDRCGKRTVVGYVHDWKDRCDP